MEAIAPKRGVPVMRPIRHPEQLQPAVQHATNFALLLSLHLLKSYAPEKIEESKRHYVDKIRQRAVGLLSTNVIIAPWKDNAP